MSYIELLGFTSLWASSMCFVLYRVHSRFEDIWMAIGDLSHNKLDKEP